MIKRILVDLSDTRRGESIVSYATDLACAHRAEVTAIRAAEAEERPTVGRLQGIAAAGWARELHRQSVLDAQQATGAVLEQLCSRCTAQGIPFEITEREDDTFRSVVETFQSYDLLACGTNPRFEDTGLETGSEELIQLVEHGVRPILAVSDAYRPIRRVLVALSGDSDSAQTFKQFVQLGMWPDAEVEIVTFVDDESAQRILSGSLRYCRRHGIEPHQQVLRGPMSEELLPHAVESGADCIVIGNSDHSRLARWFFGGAVMEIIRESDRSLFLSQ